MERKSSGKISRILFTLLVCACAALPATAVEKCHGGYHVYFVSPFFSAPTLADATAIAHKNCQSNWPSYFSYTAASSFEEVSSAGGGQYFFTCWKCSDFPLMQRFPLETALDTARAAHMGTVVGASTDEIDIDGHTPLWVYNIDIQQGDEIFRVCVDAMTGEVVAASPADAGGQ